MPFTNFADKTASMHLNLKHTLKCVLDILLGEYSHTDLLRQ